MNHHGQFKVGSLYRIAYDVWFVTNHQKPTGSNSILRDGEIALLVKLIEVNLRLIRLHFLGSNILGYIDLSEPEYDQYFVEVTSDDQK